MTTASQLFITGNSLPTGTRTKVIALLNLRLADAVDLGTQAKQAHWNVKGPEFGALHVLFDAIHVSVDGYVDLIAERVVQLGGVAQGTARDAAKRTELHEYPDVVDGAEHVVALAGALAAFGTRMRAAIESTSGWHDPDSADICTEVSRGIDKWLWMVEAHGQSAPTVRASSR